jgi:iron complex outermembrane receptor protein
MDLGTQLTLDATFRYVGALPQPHLNAYVELETFASYRVSRSLDLSISGFNLLQARHLEYPDPSGEYIRRLVMAQASLRF